MAFVPFEHQIPGTSLNIRFEAGKSTVFVGANGSGKTRLGVYIEQILLNVGIVRIAAHRLLTVSDNVSLISFQKAIDGLYSGNHNDSTKVNRATYKYGNKPAIAPLNDYELLLQALFAEQASIAVKHLHDRQIKSDIEPPTTVIMALNRIWKKLLPHRELVFEELSIKARPVGIEGSPQQMTYAASEMSDGERVILYLMAQSLLAPKDCAILIDEPELHIHKALMSRMWDIIEAERPDCTFIYITHDLDFVTSRVAAKKYVIRSFTFPSTWHVEEIPSQTVLPEYVYTEIVGSRQPIMFVEGDRGSVDILTYRHAYPNYLIEPVGGCEAVIHAVSSFNKNSAVHRIIARGCIDADARQQDEIHRLKAMNIYVLPVAEIENFYLLPNVFKALAESLHFDSAEQSEKLDALTVKIVEEAERLKDQVVVRYAARVIDADLKKLAPKAKTLAEFKQKLSTSLSQLDPEQVADNFRIRLEKHIADRNLIGILQIVDSKGLLSMGAQVLGIKDKDELVRFASRTLSSKTPGNLAECFKAELPEIQGPTVLEIGKSLPGDETLATPVADNPIPIVS